MKRVMSLKDYGVIENLKPIGGGWRYQQEYNNGLHRIPTTGSAKNARHLVELVITFRINQGILPGSPEQEIADYIKAASPQNNRWKKAPQTPIPRTTPTRPLIHILREWLESMKLLRPKLVSTYDATPRAQTCIKCPQNIRWQTKCGPCNAEVEFMGAVMRGITSFALDDALNACRLHQIYLRCAVFLDCESHPPRHPQAPAPCWIGKT